MLTIWMNDVNLNEWCQFEWMMSIWMNDDNLNEWCQFEWMMTIWINDDNLNELCQFEWTLVIRMNYDDLNEWGFQNDFFVPKRVGSNVNEFIPKWALHVTVISSFRNFLKRFGIKMSIYFLRSENKRKSNMTLWVRARYSTI